MEKDFGFSPWLKWTEKDKMPGDNIKYPGIYILAGSINRKKTIKTNKPIKPGESFSFREDIVYIGMTNAVLGLKGRLAQFDNTIQIKHLQHGGADRMLFENRDYNELVRNLYFAYRYFRFNPAHKNTKHEVLRKMGEVTKAEYHCLANYLPRPGYPWVIFSYLVGI